MVLWKCSLKSSLMKYARVTAVVVNDIPENCAHWAKLLLNKKHKILQN
jgi:hypothetical protein